MAGLMILLQTVFLKNGRAGAARDHLGAALFAAAAFNFLLVEGLGGAVTSMPVSIEDTRERFALAWHRLTMDSVSYISVVIVVLTNTMGLIIATLLPRYAKNVLGVNTENVIFVVTPRRPRHLAGDAPRAGDVRPCLGVVERRRIVRRDGRHGAAAGARRPPSATRAARHKPRGLFGPGPFGESSAYYDPSVLGAALAFAFTRS